MLLLSRELREALPNLLSLRAFRDPIATGRLFLPDCDWEFFAFEGAEENNDYILLGIVPTDSPVWQYVLLSDLQRLTGAFGEPVQEDTDFAGRRLQEVLIGDQPTNALLGRRNRL